MSGAGELERAVEAIVKADLLVVATGAGMSKESGVPTFREAQHGLWARYRPEELASPEGFRRDPARVWGWYNYRRQLAHKSTPHGGHRALAKLEALVPRLAVVTQNVDGMHQRAGSRTVIELHGNLQRFKCFDHGHPVELEPPLAEVVGSLEPPRCGHCGSYVRPDVVWFGETLSPGSMDEAQRLAQSCDVMLVVGTSGIVYPAAGLPLTARAGGATLIEVNVVPSELTRVMDIVLAGAASSVLPELVSRIEVMRG